MNKSTYVASELENDIRNSFYATGVLLPSESELCAKYDVSRMTIRSAITILTGKGLVETYQGKGTVVLPIDNSFSREVFGTNISRVDFFEFRRIIEVECAGLAAQRATSEDIELMRKANANMCESKKVDDIAKYDNEFHMHIAKATKNTMIIGIFKLLSSTFANMFRQNVSAQGPDCASGHDEILSAIEIRDSKLAQQYMREHLNKSLEKISMNSIIRI